MKITFNKFSDYVSQAYQKKQSNYFISMEKVNNYSLFLQCGFYFITMHYFKVVINKENIDGSRVSMGISQRMKCLVLQDCYLDF